jgi:hypothetical protein
VCGGAFVVAVLVSVILFPPGPNSGDDPTAILGYYTAHHGFDVISDLWSMGATFLLLALLCAAAASNGAGRGLRGRPALMLAAGAAACALELLASAIRSRSGLRDREQVLLHRSGPPGVGGRCLGRDPRHAHRQGG